MSSINLSAPIEIARWCLLAALRELVIRAGVQYLNNVLACAGV